MSQCVILWIENWSALGPPWLAHLIWSWQFRIQISPADANIILSQRPLLWNFLTCSSKVKLFQCMNNLANQQIKAWMVPSSSNTSWHAFVTLLWHKIFNSCLYHIFIGCELSKDKREYIWTAPEESEDDIEHKLQISQVRLIHDVQSFFVSIMLQECPAVFSLYSHKINFVVVHVKTRLTDIACACVMKWTGPTWPSHVSQLRLLKGRNFVFVRYSIQL